MKTKLDFLIYSPPKTGSTSLAGMLDMHPDISSIITPKSKEPGFFHAKTIEEDEIIHYNNCFKEDGTLKFEKSTSYFSSPFAAKQIKNFCKNEVKFITVLRNPIDRFVSLYAFFRLISSIHEHGLGDKAREFVHFKVPDDPIFHNFPSVEEIFNQQNPRHWAITSGLYVNHLDRLHQLFDKKSILLVNYEYFKEKPENVLDSILKFLNVDNHMTDIATSIRWNSRTTWQGLCNKLGISTSCSHIEDKWIKQLKDYYYEHNNLMKEKYFFKHSWNY